MTRLLPLRPLLLPYTTPFCGQVHSYARLRASRGLVHPKIFSRPCVLTVHSRGIRHSSKAMSKEDVPQNGGNRDQIWNLPNALTMARILATPGVGWLIYNDYYKCAILSFFATGFLDWLDGYLARKLNQQTIFGSFLDPLADKVFVGTTLFALCLKAHVPWQLGVLIIGRDVLLVGGSFIQRYRTRPEGVGFFETGAQAGVLAVAPSAISKFNTLAQFGLIWFTLTHHAVGIPPEFMLPYLWATVGASTFASGFDYYIRNHKTNIFQTPKSKGR